MTTTVEAPAQATGTTPTTVEADGGRPLRAHVVPHAAVGALVVAAGAARLAAGLTGDDQVVATWTALSAFVIAVVAATTVRRRVFDKRTRRRAFAFIAVAAGWLTTVTAVGLSVGAIGLLMAIGYGLSLHWWRTHPIGVPTDGGGDVVEPQTQPAAVEPHRYIELWATNIGCARGRLPGSRLTDPEPIRAGIRFALMLVPGQQDLELVEGLLSKLRGGLELHRHQQLIVEAHPSLAEPHLQLTVVTRSPVTTGVLWPGPDAFDPDTGRVKLGPYADGEGTATWRAYTSNRLWGGFIQGGTGSGKSRLIDSIAMSLASSHTHPTVIWYGDGQGGASSPMLMRHADLFAGTHQRIHAMVAAMELVMLLRQRENVETESEGFEPTPTRPGLLGIIDECHKPLRKAENPRFWEDIQRIAATISREGGKVGVALILASQEPTLNAFGGAGSPYCEALRSSLLTGNGIMLAGDDPNAKTIFEVSANPKRFPAGGGYGYVAKPADGERAALFRSYFLDDQLKKTWPERITWRSLDGLPAAAVAPGYSGRERTYTDRKRVVNGMPLTTAPTPGTPASASAGGTLDTFGGKGFPAWSAFAAKLTARPKPSVRPELGDGHRKVLAAIRQGHQRPAAIMTATGYSERQVYNLLDALTAADLIRKTGYGRYSLTDAA